EKYNSVKDIFNKASDIIGMDMAKIIFDGDQATLGRTDITQPAVTLINIAVKNLLKEFEIESTACAGHSLGEWTAYSDAGILSDEDVLLAVSLRGKYMNKAGEDACGTQSESGSFSSMAAVIGLELEEIKNALKDIEGIYTANWNAPKQTAISGTQQGLADAETALKEAGARRVIRLQVSAPCHSPLLEPAKENFSSFLDTLEFKNPVKTIYSNVSGDVITSGAEAKELALKQIVAPVLWVAEEEKILSGNYDKIIETGPGNILSGLMKKMNREIKILPCGTTQQIEEIKCC
ncbi:MAG: ACP S-malonyltransferase, partial [Spirochaetales bacterium]|nr:ACP S-malonyltransferase [Spirochaetales bacterium]